jgi:hypothetical protein
MATKKKTPRNVARDLPSIPKELIEQFVKGGDGRGDPGPIDSLQEGPDRARTGRWAG